MRIKINIAYKIGEDNYGVESLWTIKSGNFYKLDNIPFFVYNLAYGDIVAIEEDNEEKWFDELIESSENSLVQLELEKDSDDSAYKKEVGERFEALGCDWEGMKNSNRIGVNIPKEIDYLEIKKELENGLIAGAWDYKEACLSDTHQSHIEKTE